MVAQFWLEHRPVTPEVASSSLVYPAKKDLHSKVFFVYLSSFKESFLPKFNAEAEPERMAERPDRFVRIFTGFITDG